MGLPGIGALAVVLVLTMLITPFLHNAPTVLIMGPIAASLAGKLGLNPDAFLKAVALGAGVRFPDADRASVQHAGDGAGRVPVRRLRAAGGAVVARGGGWRVCR